jgi:hypothetical protein
MTNEQMYDWYFEKITLPLGGEVEPGGIRLFGKWPPRPLLRSRLSENPTMHDVVVIHEDSKPVETEAVVLGDGAIIAIMRKEV